MILKCLKNKMTAAIDILFQKYCLNGKFFGKHSIKCWTSRPRSFISNTEDLRSHA